MALDTFSELLGRVWGDSCVFFPAYTPCSMPGCGLGIRATHLWHSSVGFSCYFLFCFCDPPPLEIGGDLGILAPPIVARGCVTSCNPLFRHIISCRPSSLILWRYFGFRVSVDTFSPRPPPLQVITVVFVNGFPIPYGYASFLARFSWRYLSAL